MITLLSISRSLKKAVHKHVKMLLIWNTIIQRDQTSASQTTETQTVNIFKSQNTENGKNV